MNAHVKSLLDKFDSVSKYQPDKQTEAVALIVALDILKTILNDKNLGRARIGLVKHIAATYEINLNI